MENKKYYIVKTKCGHVGRNNWVEIDLPIMADNGKEAALKARLTPRVKHHRKDAIISVKSVSKVEYCECLKVYREDPYTKCKNNQDQRMIDGFERRIQTTDEVERDYTNKKKSARFKLRKHQIMIKEMIEMEKEYIYE